MHRYLKKKKAYKDKKALFPKTDTSPTMTLKTIPKKNVFIRKMLICIANIQEYSFLTFSMKGKLVKFSKTVI